MAPQQPLPIAFQELLSVSKSAYSNRIHANRAWFDLVTDVRHPGWHLPTSPRNRYGTVN